MNNNQRNYSFNVGFGNSPCSVVGCTISVIGDVLGVTPDVVNEKLKSVQGFSGSLVIWAKIEEAFPGVKINRVWSYNNDDVLAHVPNVIVEVPATPIGGTGSHWVNYIGNHQLKDPWTGTIRPTSDFPNPTGYCTFDLTNYQKPQDQQALIDQLRKERDDNWNLYQADEETIKNLNATIKDKNIKLDSLNTQLSSLRGDSANLSEQNKSLSDQTKQLTEEATTLKDELNQAKQDRTTYMNEIQSMNKKMANMQKELNAKRPSGFINKLIYLFS